MWLDNFDQPEFCHEWHCNLLLIQRRKCLLFTHSVTLFSFLIPGVRPLDLRRFGLQFRSQATYTLMAEGITRSQLSYLLDDGPDRIAKASNRSILGSMNDLARLCKYRVDYADNPSSLNIDELNHDLNMPPMSYIGMNSATVALKNILKAQNIE